MPIIKEWRCLAHGAFENATGKCKRGCPQDWITREIRTAPSYRRSGRMRFVDEQLKGIASDHGMTDLSNDPKSNESVLQRMLSKKRLQSQDVMPHWVEVPHAKPGFSQEGSAAVPTVNGAQFGTVTGRDILGDIPKPPVSFPKPRPIYVGKSKDDA